MLCLDFSNNTVTTLFSHPMYANVRSASPVSFIIFDATQEPNQVMA